MALTLLAVRRSIDNKFNKIFIALNLRSAGEI